MVRLVLAAAVAAFVLSGCGGGVDDDTYAKINNGMSLSKVEDLLGSGEEQTSGGTGISSSGLATGNTTPANQKTILWKDGSKQIIVEFKDGAVVSKRKIGF